jgi:hypothetical protein
MDAHALTGTRFILTWRSDDAEAGFTSCLGQRRDNPLKSDFMYEYL